MFCNQCGTQLQPDYNLCPKCGQPVSFAARPTACTNRLREHVRTLGILWIIVGALFLLPAFAAMTLGTAASMFLPVHNAVAPTVAPFVVFGIGGMLLILGIGGICVGRALRQHRPWARIVAIVLGVLALFKFPLGTALGIYTLWVLLSSDAETQYQQMARTA
jgi:zinc-ribbon domain